MLLQCAPTAVTGITGIFEDLEWFPEGWPLVDSMDGWKYKRNVALSSDCHGWPAPYQTALFISFLVQPELSFTRWHSGGKKKSVSEKLVELFPGPKIHIFEAKSQKASTDLFLTKIQLHWHFLLGDKGKLCQTMKKNYIFARNTGFAAVSSAGWRQLSWSSCGRRSTL